MNPSTLPKRPAGELRSPPWWRFRIMWMVLGLPATVVVASLFTATIAWRHIDPVITDARPSRTAADDAADRLSHRSALEPAERARNHAATPLR